MEQSVVHIIDDDESLRGAISTLLRSVGIGAISYGTCGEFLQSIPPDVPSCLLLDVRLPGLSGLEFQSQLSTHGIAMPVVMMTGYGDVPMSVRAMKAGAVDFLTKPFRDQDLLDAVSAAIERDSQLRHASAGLSELVARHDALSVREKQVMRLVTAGRLNKQVAFDLGLSEITVKLYRASAMKKMEARTFAELVKMAERLNVQAMA
ncbi:MAG: response regulator transcription factor [Novosphingobium sp.]|nr:MAG: response regulator transcription factor [Novosphingobium sp.]